jgi:ABC-type transporter Mla maintaining outer membrane lipid asymmetry ATPase subunit MlaF
MDEPFSGLDPIAKKKTQILIQKIANLDDKNTIIIVTHDIAREAWCVFLLRAFLPLPIHQVFFLGSGSSR